MKSAPPVRYVCVIFERNGKLKPFLFSDSFSCFMLITTMLQPPVSCFEIQLPWWQFFDPLGSYDGMFLNKRVSVAISRFLILLTEANSGL